MKLSKLSDPAVRASALRWSAILVGPTFALTLAAATTGRYWIIVLVLCISIVVQVIRTLFFTRPKAPSKIRWRWARNLVKLWAYFTFGLISIGLLALADLSPNTQRALDIAILIVYLVLCWFSTGNKATAKRFDRSISLGLLLAIPLSFPVILAQGALAVRTVGLTEVLTWIISGLVCLLICTVFAFIVTETE